MQGLAWIFFSYLSLFLIPFILDIHWLCRICWICLILPDPSVLPPVIAAVYSLIKYRWIMWESSNCRIRRQSTSNQICIKLFSEMGLCTVNSVHCTRYNFKNVFQYWSTISFPCTIPNKSKCWQITATHEPFHLNLSGALLLSVNMLLKH